MQKGRLQLLIFPPAPRSADANGCLLPCSPAAITIQIQPEIISLPPNAENAIYLTSLPQQLSRHRVRSHKILGRLLR